LRPERRVDSHNQVATYQCGDRIFAEGSEGDEFFIVITGLVGLSKEVDGTQKELHRIGPGEIFGEIAVISSAPRSASAIALEPDTSVIAVDKARFLYLVGQHFGFAVLVMQTLSRWLRNKGDDPDVASPTAKLNERMRTGAPCTAVPIEDDVWQLRSRSRSCNSYLFKGRDRTVLIDAGLNAGFEALAACPTSLGMQPAEIDTIILTHEHFDHIAAVPRFAGRRVVAAHRLAAHKIANGDDFAILRGAFGEAATDFPIEMILDEGDVFNTGSHRLRVFHTPGHSSGSISLFEERLGLLITGDTVLAGGNLGGVFGSGNNQRHDRLARDSRCAGREASFARSRASLHGAREGHRASARHLAAASVGHPHPVRDAQRSGQHQQGHPLASRSQSLLRIEAALKANGDRSQAQRAAGR